MPGWAIAVLIGVPLVGTVAINLIIWKLGYVWLPDEDSL